LALDRRNQRKLLKISVSTYREGIQRAKTKSKTQNYRCFRRKTRSCSFYSRGEYRPARRSINLTNISTALKLVLSKAIQSHLKYPRESANAKNEAIPSNHLKELASDRFRRLERPRLDTHTGGTWGATEEPTRQDKLPYPFLAINPYLEPRI